MINWQFNTEDYEEQSFKPIPVGDHRVRISSAEEQTSSKGKQMIKLVLDVSGYNSTIWHYIVFMPENTKLTNQKLGELWNSFGIPQGNFDLNSWRGKVGAAKIKHEIYESNPNPKVSYFIGKDRQDKLPAWQEPANAAATGQSVGAVVANDDNVPW